MLARTDGVSESVVPRPQRDAAVQLRPRPFRLPRPVVAAGDEGLRRGADPGLGAALEPGEFILGYPDEDGPRGESACSRRCCRATAATWRTGGCRSTSAAFRDYLREHGNTPEEQELLAAKFMGRWRSGAPLVLAPDAGRSRTRRGPLRNNDFNYKEMDPFGYACPLGSHARRLNPRDTAHNMNRRRMIRRGATYGPALPEGAPDDGVDRGIAAFIICADLVRQFEFAQNVWINDKKFHELGNEHDPIFGTQDGTLDFTDPEAADPQGAQGHAGVHDAHGRGVLLPARAATRCATSRTLGN